LPRWFAARVSLDVKCSKIDSFLRGRALLLALPFLTLASAARGDSIWNATTGDWNVSGNWSPSGVPGTFTDVRIGTTSTNFTANITSANASSGWAYIGYASGNVGTVNVLNGWTWTSTLEIDIGLDGNGTINVQSGGKVSGLGVFGRDSSGVGSVIISGIGSRWSGSLTVGDLGTGTLTIQSGGSASTSSG